MASKTHLTVVLSLSFLLLSISGTGAFRFSNMFGDDQVAPAPEPVLESALSPGLESALSPAPSPMSIPSLSHHMNFVVPPVSTLAPSSDFTSSIPYDVRGQVTQFIEANMVSALNKTQGLIDGIAEKLKDPAASPITKECLRQCEDVYKRAIEAAKTGLTDSLRTGNLGGIEKDIGDAASSVDLCEQCDGEDGQFKAHSEWIKGITNQCLAKLEELRS